MHTTIEPLYMGASSLRMKKENQSTMRLLYSKNSFCQDTEILNSKLPHTSRRPRGSVNNSFQATQRVAKCFIPASGGKYPHYQTPVSLLIGSPIVSELLAVIISHPIGSYVVLPYHWSQCGHCNRHPSVVIGWL